MVLGNLARFRFGEASPTDRKIILIGEVTDEEFVALINHGCHTISDYSDIKVYLPMVAMRKVFVFTRITDWKLLRKMFPAILREPTIVIAEDLVQDDLFGDIELSLSSKVTQ